MLLGLPFLDIAVIVVYFLVVIIIGFLSMRRISNSEDYFLGGRRFGKWIQTFAAFGQGTSAETAVTTTTMVSTNGAAGIGMGLISGVVTMPVFWMITMWYRRLRYYSLAEFFAERYNSRLMAGFYAIAQSVLFMIVAAGGFTAMSKTVSAIAIKPESALTQSELEEKNSAVRLKELKQQDFRLLSSEEKEELVSLTQQHPRQHFSYVNRTILTICLAIVILLYAVSGGLQAAFITDMIQGVFILILTLMLIPFAMIKINHLYGKSGFMGTFEALHQNLPDSFFEVLGSPNVPQFTWYFICAFGVLAMINTAVQANQLTTAGSAKDDQTARVGFINGIFIKRYCSVIWGFIAMMTLLLYGREVSDPDYVWGMATRELLPVGLVGLMIACLMAALMSTADAHMLTSSSLLTNSMYRPFFPGKSEAHYVFVGRLFCIVYIIGGVSIALLLDDVFGLFIFMITFNSMIAASFWLGMLWRRSTRNAAWVSIVVTLLFSLLLPVLIPLFPGVREGAYFAKQTKSYTVENSYIAKAVDAEMRDQDIRKWKELDQAGLSTGDCPDKLIVGEPFLKYSYVEPKSIFWQKGLTTDDAGNMVGRGMLKVELVLLDLTGVNLQAHKLAFNETLTAIFRIIVPFGFLILFSFFTKQEDKDRLDFFYARLRTPALANPKMDVEAVKATKADPSRFDSLKLFPDSNWEFRKWTRSDWIGQGGVLIASIGLFILMWMLVTFGK